VCAEWGAGVTDELFVRALKREAAKKDGEMSYKCCS